MITARQKILNFIVERQSTTVDELSKVFRVTPANIRHHLSVLTQQGSIKVIGLKPTLPKGRAAQIYAASQQNERDNLDRLSDILLRTIMHNATSHQKNKYIQEIADRICIFCDVSSSNPTKRLYTAIRSLNKMNYQAHWEAHIDNPRIMIGQCPYQPILEDHPELCQIDTALLENLLGTHVTQIEKQIFNAKNLPQCVFLIDRSV